VTLLKKGKGRETSARNKVRVVDRKEKNKRDERKKGSRGYLLLREGKKGREKGRVIPDMAEKARLLSSLSERKKGG